MDISVDSPSSAAATEAEQASAAGPQHTKLIDKGSDENVQEEEGTGPIIDGQSYSHASPNLEAKQIDGPLSVDTSSSSSSSSSPNELDQTFSIDKSSNSNSMDLTFSLCDDEEEEDDDEMEDGEGAEYDITTGSTRTGNAGGGGESDLGGSSILLQNMSHHSFDDIQFFPSSHHRAMRLQPQFQFHQDQLNDPNFHLAPNLSCFDASGLVNLSGSGSVSNSYSLINGDPTSGDINSAFSENPFVFPDDVMAYGEPTNQFFPGNCVGYLETILEDDEEIEEEEGCSGRHWWTADSDTDTDSVIRVDHNGQTQPEPIGFQHASSMSLTIPGEKDEVKHHFRSSASSKPFELEDLHLFDQLDHAFEETLSEPKRRAAFGFLHQSQSAEQPLEPNNSSLNNAAGGNDSAKGCQKSLPGGESQNEERKKDSTSMESVGNTDNRNEVTTKGLNMLTKENVKAHSVENSSIIYEVSEEKEQNSKKLGNAESRETFGSSLSPSSSDSEAPPEVAEEDFFYSSPGSDEEECRSQEETETDSCSSDDSEKKGVVLAEFSLGSSGGSFNSGMMFGNNKNRRSFEAPSRLKSFRSFDSLNCLAGTELLFSKPETFPSIDHIREVSEPSSESESSNDRNLIPEEDEEDISEEDKMDNMIKHADGPQSLPIPSSNSLLPGPNSNVICNKNSTSSSTPVINTNATSGAGLRSTENLSEDSGIGNDTNDGISTTAASTPGAFIEESNVIMSSNGKQPHEDCKKEALNGSTSPTALKIIAVQEADKSSLQLDSAKDFISSAEFALNPFVYSSLSSSEPESSNGSLTCNGSLSLHSINKMNVTYNDQSLTQTHLNGKERAIIPADLTKDQETTSNNKSHESLINSVESPQLHNGESRVVDGNMSRHRSKLSPPPSPEQTTTVSSNFTQDIMGPGDNNESSQDRHQNGCEGQPIIISNSAVATPFLSDANREQHPAKNSPSIEELASMSKSALPSYFAEPPVGSPTDREICVTNRVIKTVSSSSSDGEVFSMSKVDEEEQEHSSSSSYSSSSGDEQNVPRFHRQRSDSESEYELAETALQKDNEKMAYDIIVNSPKKKKGLEELSSSSSSSLSSSSLAHEQLTLSSTSTSAPTIQPAKHQIHNSQRQDELNTNKCSEKSGPVSALSSSSLINIHRNGDDDHGSNMQSDGGDSASGGEKEKNNLANTPGMRNERLPVFESSIDDYDDDDNGHDCVAENTSARIAKTLPMSENIGATSNNNMATTPDCGMGVSSNVSRYLVCNTTPTSQREGHNMKPYSDQRVIENSSSATSFLHHHQLPPDYNNKREQYENSDELTGAPQSQQIHMVSCTGSVVGGGGELSVGKQEKKLSGQVIATTQQSQSSPTTHNTHQDHHHHNSLRSSVRESTSADVAHHQSNNPQRNLIEQQNAFHPAGVAQRSAHSGRAPANNSANNNRSHCANISDPRQSQSQVLAGEPPYEEDPYSGENELVFADSYYPNQIDTAVVKKFLATYVAPKESSGSFFGPLEHKPILSSFASTTCAEKDSTAAAFSAPTHKSKNKLGNGKEGVAHHSQPASNPSPESISTRSNFGSSLHSHTNTYTEAHDHHHHEYGFPSRPVVQGGKDLHSQATWEEEPKLVQPLKENNSFCPSSIQKTSPIQYNTVGSNNSSSVRRSVSPSSLPSSKRQDIGKGAARGDQHSTKDNNIYTGIDKFSVGLCAIKAAVVAVAPSIPSYIVKEDVGTERNSDSGIGKEKNGRNLVRENGALSTPFTKETVKTCSVPCNSDNTALLKDGEYQAHELTTQPQPSRQTVNVPDILNLNQHSCMPSSAGGYSEEANNKNSVTMEDTMEMQRGDSPTHSGLPLRTKKYGPRNEVEIVLVSSRTPSPAPGGFVSTSSSFPSSSRKLASSSPTDQEPVCSPKPCYDDDGSNVARESSIPPPPLSPPVTTSTKTHRSRVHFSPVVSEISWRESYIDQSSECSGSTDDLLTKLETLDGIHGVRAHHGKNWSEHSDSNESAGLRKAGGGDQVGGNNSGDNRVGSDEVGSSKVRPLQVYDIQMSTRADSPNSLVSGRGVSPGRGPILVEKVEMTSSLLHDPEEKNNRHLLLGESQPSRKLVLHKDNEDVDNDDDEKVTDLVDFRNGANNDICGNDQNNGTLGVYEDVEVQIEPSEKTPASTTLSMVPDLLSQCENTSNTLTHIDVKIEESIPELNTKNIVLNIGPPPTNRGNDRHHQPQKKVDKLPQPHELSTSPEPKQIFPKMFAEDKNDKRNLSSSSLTSSSKPKKPSKGFSIQGLGSSGKKSEKDGPGLNGTNGNSSQTLTINDGGAGESKQEPGVTEAAKENKKSSKPGFFERLSKIRLSSGSKNKKQKVHPKSGEIHQEVDPSGPPPVTSTIAGTGTAGRPLRSANSVNVNGKSNSSGANNTTPAGFVQPILKKSTASSSTIPTGAGGPHYNGSEMGIIGDSENEPDDANQAFENILEEIAGLKSIQLRQEKSSSSSIDKSPTSQQMRSFAKRKQFYSNAGSPSPPVSPTSNNSQSYADLDSKLTQFKEDTSRTLDAISKSHPDLEAIEDVVKQRQKSLSPEPRYQAHDMDANQKAMASTLPKSSKAPNSETIQNSEREWYKLMKSATEKYAYHNKGPTEDHFYKEHHASHKTGIVETDLDTGASREMLDEDMLQLDCKVPCYTMSTSEIPTSVASTSVSMVTSAGSPATSAKTRSLTNLSSRLPLSIAPSQFEESTGDLSDSEERAKSLEFLLDENHKSSSVPPENKLRQLETRQLSEHELRIQRSLQRLNVPEWYKQHGTLSTGPINNVTPGTTTAQNKSATLSILKRAEYGSSGGLAGGWSGLSTYKAPSMSSLQSNGGRHSGTLNKSNFVRGRPQTMSATRTSKESLLASGSASHSPSAFERSSFTYGMPFTMTRFGQGRLSTHSGSVSPPSTPDSTTKVNSYIKKPYLGWRSQEKLNAANAAAGAGNAAGAPKLSIYLPPAERLAADLMATRAKSPVRPPVSDRPPLPKAPPRSEKTTLTRGQGANDEPAETALSSTPVISKQTSMAVVTKLPQQSNSIPPPELSHGRNGHSQHHSKNQSSPNVHDSIRQVTTAISHFVGRGQHETTQPQQRTKPKVGKKPAIWIESSFVGQKPSSTK